MDLNYTLYHPLEEKYIGIFPRQDPPEESEHMDGPPKTIAQPPQEKPAMWTIVEACMSNGTLQELRDGKLQTNIAMRPQSHPAAQKSSRSTLKDKDRKTQVRDQTGGLTANDHEDESDGGFFEE